MADGKIMSCGAGQHETDGKLHHIVHDMPADLFYEIKALPCRFSKRACVTEGRKICTNSERHNPKRISKCSKRPFVNSYSNL